MNKEIKDYLHLYLGCIGERTIMDYPGARKRIMSLTLDTFLLHSLELQPMNIFFKPILRPLDSMTEKEKDEFAECGYEFEDEDNRRLPVNIWKGCNMSDHVLWLLSKHFDLFGLIPEGLAIDKSSLQTNQKETK